MQLTELRIRNFRSYGDVETKVELDKLTAVIGANSSGKTALIHALLKIFGPTSSDRQIVRSDFHVPHDKKPEEMRDRRELMIEVKIELPELSDANAASQSVPAVFEQMVTGHPHEVPYLRIRLDAVWSPGHTPDGEIDTFLNYITVPYGEDESDALKAVASHQRALIQMIYVPAVRNPASQLRTASGTILWRLFRRINWPEKTEEELGNRLEPLSDFFDTVSGLTEIRRVISEEWQRYHTDFRYHNTQISFATSDLESILKKVEVKFSPTEDITSYTIDKLGDGLRSLFYLSLVSSLLEIERQCMTDVEDRFIGSEDSTALVVMAVEEPENHISPMLLGRVMNNLREISTKSNAQVILSSHSSSIIKRVEPTEIRHARMGTGDTKRGTTILSRVILPEKTDEAYKYVKEAVKAYPELYFAKLVVLGEGDSEELIIPKFLEANDVIVDNETISIVPLGGRHVNHFWRLLRQLDIPHITLLDFDRERGGGGWTRIKYALDQLLENGVDRDVLLEIRDGVLTDAKLAAMHTRSLDDPTSLQNMDMWLRRLEMFGVFFSMPLDIDFMMLEAFFDQYKAIPPRGPDVPDETDDPLGHEEAIEEGVRATLKKQDRDASNGYTYTSAQRELMPWYKTLFLGRSKPSTHIEALASIEKSVFRDQCPVSLKKVIEAVEKHLRDR